MLLHQCSHPPSGSVPMTIATIPSLPVCLSSRRNKRRRPLPLSLDPRVPSTARIIISSSGLRALLRPNARVHVVVRRGVKYCTLSHHQSPSFDFDSLFGANCREYSYNSWRIGETTGVCVRHRVDWNVQGLGSVSVKTVAQAHPGLSSETRIDLWLHAYLRGMHTIALAWISPLQGNTDSGMLNRIEYMSMADLVDANMVAPYTRRLESVLRMIDESIVDDGFYCVMIDEMRASIYASASTRRLGVDQGKEGMDFAAKLDQLEFE